MRKIFAFKQNDVLLIFNIGKTENDKIANRRQTIVQQYAFSREQYESIFGEVAQKPLLDFFSKDSAVCFDCPFNSQGSKRCYTHKYGSFKAFLGVLKAVKTMYKTWNEIPTISDIPAELLSECKGRYIRFGVYGETILLPLLWVSQLTAVCSSWTGYTHQWKKESVQPYSAYFTASTESKETTFLAMALGWRVFEVTKTTSDGLVNCPASEESGYKTNCATCKRCRGNASKAKSVYIIEH